MVTIVRKSFPVVQSKVLDADQGLVECVFGCTSNLDRQNDIIEPGAFAKALAASIQYGDGPTVVYSHKWDDIHQVLGHVVQWGELRPGDPALPYSLNAKGYGGVRASVKFDLDTPAGKIAFTHVRNKNLKQWSFAFNVDEGGSEHDEKGVRHIKSISEIFEVSLVLIGANPATVTVGAKTARMKAIDQVVGQLVTAMVARSVAEIKAETKRPRDSDVITEVLRIVA